MKINNLYKYISAVTLAAVIGTASSTAMVITPDYFKTSSALSSGKWVKVKVTESGMHEITDDQLRAMGFSNPEKVAVYGFSATTLSSYQLSVAMPEDLPAVPAIRANGKLIFYAEPDVTTSMYILGSSIKRTIVDVKRNYFAQYSTLFLTDSKPLVEPEAVTDYVPSFVSSATSVVSTSRGMVHYEKEVQNKGEIGARFFGPDFADEPTQTYIYEMPGYNATGSSYIQIVGGMIGDNSSNVPIVLPDNSTQSMFIPQLSKAYNAYRGITFQYTVTPPISDNGTYLTTIDTEGTNITYGGLDYLTVTYPRNNNYIGDSKLLGFTSLDNNSVIEIADAPEDMMVWDVTSRNTPRYFPTFRTANGSERFSFNASVGANAYGNCAYAIAFSPSQTMHTVEYMGEVANQDIHAAETPHMVIITASAYRAQAERLAQLHRDLQGIDVLVYDQDDIYNEFSSGTPHVMAFRRMAAMFYSRNPEKFRSVLIFGAAYFDNRGITVADKANFHAHNVPMLSREEIDAAGALPKSYITDHIVGMMEENILKFDIGAQKMQINVGRIPCDNVEEATVAVDKVEKLLTTTIDNDAYTRMIAMCDAYDHYAHTTDSEDFTAIVNAGIPAITTNKLYSSYYPLNGKAADMLNERTKHLLKKGVSYWTYSGHSSPAIIGNNNLWNYSLNEATSHDILPFVMFATCRAIYFDHEGGSIGERMLFKPDGGCFAMVASNREVYKEHNQPLNESLVKYYIQATPGTTYGQIFRDARNDLVPYVSPSNTDPAIYERIVNTMCYNYLGDPELPIPVPEYKLEITGINGEAPVAAEQTGSLKSGVVTNLTGVVKDAEGNEVTDFNGKIFFSLYDGARNMNAVTYSAGDTIAVANVNEDVIYEGLLKVTNGRFNSDVIMPIPYYTDNNQRMVLYAASDDNRQALGYISNYRITEPADESEIAEGQLPVISEFYINEPGNDNITVEGNATVYATIAPNFPGILVNTTQMGKSLALILDHKTVYPGAITAFNLDVDGGGTLEFPITMLPDGPHTLSLRVVNTLGQQAEQTINFTVVNNMAAPKLSIAEFPAKTQMTINLNHAFEGTPTGRIIIKDAYGKVVHTATDETTFPYRWDLKDTEGNPVPNGCYSVSAFLKSGMRYGGTEPIEAIVHR